MKHNLFAKAVALAIVFFFLGSSVIPTLQGSGVNRTKQSILAGERGYFYAYNAYDPNGMNYGEVTFDMDAVVNLIGGGSGITFITGEDIDTEGNCYGVAYYGGL